MGQKFIDVAVKDRWGREVCIRSSKLTDGSPYQFHFDQPRTINDLCYRASSNYPNINTTRSNTTCST